MVRVCACDSDFAGCVGSAADCDSAVGTGWSVGGWALAVCDAHNSAASEIPISRLIALLPYARPWSA